MEVLRPDTRIGPDGRFVIRNLIGSGGMGQVYRAVDTIMKREVAIKTLHKDLVAAEPHYAERFLNEAIAAGGITHQHVVKIHDYGVHDGQPFIVMEYLQGKSLSDVVLEAPLLIERAVDIVLSACSAVYFCHRHNIYHRDLKPSNVFLVDTEDRDFDHVVVLDFGVAKIASQPDLTRAGSLMGTPSFLAPESIAAKKADPQSDQYSLGVLLYYALTRKLPFRGSSDYELWQAIRSGVYKSPRTLRPEIPAGLEDVIKQAMHLEASSRFTNVHMFGRALLPFGSSAGRRHWSTLFTAAPRPIKDPSPSMAIIAPPAEQQATAIDLTRTRDAHGSPTARASVPTPSDTTIDSIPTVRDPAAIAGVGLISIAISGELASPGSVGSVALRAAPEPPPEPIEPPATPAAFAAAGTRPPATLRSRLLNPRVIAVAASAAGIAIVGIAISIAGRSSSPVPSSKPPIPPAASVSAASRPEPPPTAAAQAPAPTLPPAPPVDSRSQRSSSDVAMPDVEAKRIERPPEGKPRRHSRRVRRDENGFPIIE
jgi:eukaryotic-like serine/threonine-protein kinase